MRPGFFKNFSPQANYSDEREWPGGNAETGRRTAQSYYESGSDQINRELHGAYTSEPLLRWKRALDICVVLAALPFLAPLWLMITLIIKAGSKGPVFFKQDRVGLRGSRFTIFKFRTMKVGASTSIHEDHTSALIENNQPMTKLDAYDDRLIPLGRELRAAGLDELPQLINVLRGEMSIVGPRPCLPSEFSRYSLAQRERFNSPPGLTGLWQVSGKNKTTFSQMMDLDIHYVRNRSLWLDLKIILKTPLAIVEQVRGMERSN
jgi:lipopolysaccharide/colanic/teichoic acid biosynthesis glycosyltransferase